MAAVLILAVVLRIFYGSGDVAYDGMYSLVWGRDIAHGAVPDFGVAIAPTPHPLLLLAGAVLSPLGEAAEPVFETGVVVAFAAVGWLAFEVGRRMFSVAVGLLFALILLTRKILVAEALQASQDIPFLALVLAALLLEIQKPRRGVPVLALLTLAGLLRPEAWLLSLAYLIYLRPTGTVAARLRVTALALSAPVLWALTDLLITGNPLHSLHGTQDLAAELRRPRSIETAFREVPVYTRVILFNPLTWLGITGTVLALYSFGARVRLPISVGVLGLLAFFILGLTDLPLLIRYLLVPAAMLALFAAVALFGWMSLPRTSPHRSVWLAACPILLIPVVLSVPRDLDRIDSAKRWVTAQRHAQTTLEEAISAPRAAARLRTCRRPVYVPNHRVIPVLAFLLDEQPRAFVAVSTAPARGLVIAPGSPAIAATLLLAPQEPRPTSGPPRGFERVARTPEWSIYARC